MTMLPEARRGRGTAGQSMVELALILPMVLAFLFGIIDFGYYLYVNVNVSHATREGARFAAMNNRTRAQVSSWIRTMAPGVDIPTTPEDAITITTMASDPDFFQSPPSVAVTVTFQHTFLVPLFFIGRSTANVWSSSKMIIQTWETSPTITF